VLKTLVTCPPNAPVLCAIVGIFMRGFHVPLDEIETHLNMIDGDGGLELEHVVAMKRCVSVCVFSIKS